MPAMPIDKFLFTPEDIETWCEGKHLKRAKPTRHVHEPDWTIEHEQLFLLNNLLWPPSDDLFKSILDNFGREREAQLVYLADAVFKEVEFSKTTYFDANHAANRVLKPDDASTNVSLDVKLRNPWRLHVPTLTCLSSIAMRTLLKDGSTCITRLHALEQMQLIGWDKSMFRGQRAPWDHATPELLGDMAGNAWSAFAIAPLLVAVVGSVPWTLAAGLLTYKYVARCQFSSKHRSWLKV